MKKPSAIACVFVDVGGVLLTNGWDHHARRRAAAKFRLDWAGMEERHRLVFEIHEEGKISFRRIPEPCRFLRKAAIHAGAV